MVIEMAVPATLPLGLANLKQGSQQKIVFLALTIQHPPIHLLAQPQAKLEGSGARADLGYEFARRFLTRFPQSRPARLDIELAIPSAVGLGSEPLLGLAVTRTLAHLNGMTEPDGWMLSQALGLDAQHASAFWSFERGGLLLVENQPDGIDAAPKLVQRAEIAHNNRDAWAFVLLLPRGEVLRTETSSGEKTENATESNQRLEALEAERHELLTLAAPHVAEESGEIVREEIFPAVQRDDIAAFGRGVMQLQAHNRAALAQVGLTLPASGEQAVFDLLRDSGALAWGQSLTGTCLFALVKGAQASIDLRTQLRQKLGVFSGRVMATITDNEGARYIVKDHGLNNFPIWDSGVVPLG